MAVSKKTTQAKTEVSSTKETSAPVEKKQAPKFKDGDMIRCISCTSGRMFVVGIKTEELYTFVDIGDAVNIAYEDIIAMIRKKDAHIYKPMFVIDNAEFLSMYKDIASLYDGLYSEFELRDILEYPIDAMVNAIHRLPPGARDAIKNIVADAIDSGRFDSVNKIKAIDEIFETQLLLKLIK